MTCPGCGATLTPWRVVPGGEPADAEHYEVVRCASCRTAVTIAPAPGDAYETGIYTASEPRLAGLLACIQGLALGQPVRLLRRNVPAGGSVLDAGAGRGRLVAALNAAGFAARGIDPSSRNAELAASTGIAVQNARLESHEESDLDAVVLWHVLEHLDDPLAALERVRGWLRPSGALLVSVPNVSSLQRRIAGGAWFHFDAPRHRVHLSRVGLLELLDRAGFEPVEEQHLVWQHNLHGMWFALLTRLGMSPGFPFHLAKRNIRARPRDLVLVVAGLPLLPVALVLEAVAAAARRGGTLAVLSRPRTAPPAPGRNAPR